MNVSNVNAGRRPLWTEAHTLVVLLLVVVVVQSNHIIILLFIYTQLLFVLACRGSLAGHYYTIL